MSETKRFHLGAVLSIVHGRLLCTGGMDDVYKILSWMTDDDLYTHQLSRASSACEPLLKSFFPVLDTPEVKGDVEGFGDSLSEFGGDKLAIDEAVSDWLQNRAAEWGEWFDVPRLPESTWKYRDPFAELVGMVGEDRVLVVSAESEAGA